MIQLYRRITEQVSISIAASFLGMLSSFIIIQSTAKVEYGILVSSISLQYVISRLILSGILVEVQLAFSKIENISVGVPAKFLNRVFIYLFVNAFTFGLLSLGGGLRDASLGVLIGSSMLLSVGVMSIKSWFWYRASILIPETFLLLCVSLKNDSLDLNLLSIIYKFYYGLQGAISLIGLVRSNLKIIKESKPFDQGYGSWMLFIASASSMAKDRLTLAVAAFLYPSEALAELSYLMMVMKGVLSIGATATSVKFIYSAGLDLNFSGRKKSKIIENIALFLLTLIGYALFIYYNHVSQRNSYLDKVGFSVILMMVVSTLIIYNHSVWYSNLVLNNRLDVYNKAAVLFILMYGLFYICLSGCPRFNIYDFFFGTQCVLLCSMVVADSFFKNSIVGVRNSWLKIYQK